MKRIVIFYPYETKCKAFSGGVPKVVISNIIAVQSMGHEPHVILPSDNSGLIGFIEKNHPYCKIHPIKFKSLSLFSDTKGIIRYIKILQNLFFFLKGKRKIKEEIKKIDPEIIHFHEVINFLLLDIYKKSTIILHLHSYRFVKYKRLLVYMMRLINLNVDLVISPTKSILDAIKHVLKTKSIILNTPYLDLSPNHDLVFERKDNEKQKIRFAFVGRICSIKRIHHFIEALHFLDNQQLQKIEFIIIGGTNNIGDEQYKEYISKIVSTYKLSHKVQFVGYINPIEEILPTIDYGVILSESEAVPMIGIEFMRFGIPIIGYDAPGINDFLFDKKNGFLIENGNIEELKNILQNIIDGEYMDLNFKDKIEQEYSKYTIERFTNSLQKIYEENINNNSYL